MALIRHQMTEIRGAQGSARFGYVLDEATDQVRSFFWITNGLIRVEALIIDRRTDPDPDQYFIGIPGSGVEDYLSYAPDVRNERIDNSGGYNPSGKHIPFIVSVAVL
jgi:hypothetical protein